MSAAANPIKPLIVYLDSQDYSNLAAPKGPRAQFFEQLRSELIALLDSGEIEIRYSAIHLSEIAHIKVDHLQYSAPRAEALKELCRGKCLRFYSDIADDEVAANFIPDHPIRATNDHDQWFETDLNSIGDFVEKAKEALSEALNERGANRKERRRAAKIDLRRYFLENEHGRAAVDQLVEQLNSNFALTGTIDRSVLEEYIAGSGNRSRFEQYMRGMLYDPVSLISKLGPTINIEEKLPTVVRNLGQKFIDRMNPQIDRLRELIASPFTVLSGDLVQKIREMPREMAEGLRRGTIRSKIKENHRLPQGQSDAELDELCVPVYDVYSDVLRRFLAQTVSAGEAGAPARHFKNSDAADIFHALYIPHVHIFRCDSAWTDILAPQGKRYGTEIIGKIEDLLPAIRARLDTSRK